MRYRKLAIGLMMGLSSWMFTSCGGSSGFTTESVGESNGSDANQSIGTLMLKDNANILDKNSSATLRYDANSTIANDNNYTVIYLDSNAIKDFKVGETLYIPAGVQNQFPLGKSGKIEELTVDGNVTKVLLSDIEFSEVFTKLQTTEVETQLNKDNFIGAIIPSYVQTGASVTNYRSKNSDEIVLLDGGVVIGGSSTKKFRGDVNQEYSELAQNEISLNIHIPITMQDGKLKFDFGKKEEVQEKEKKVGAEFAIDVSGKVSDLKIGFGGDMDDDAIGIKSKLHGNLETDLSFTGNGFVKLGAFDEGWKDFEETKKYLGIIKFKGVDSEDKKGKVPLVGLMYSLENLLKLNVKPQEIKKLEDLGMVDKAGFVILWVYFDLLIDLEVNGKIGSKANMTFDFGIDKERSKEVKDFRTFKEVDKDTPVYEPLYLNADASFDGKIGLSVETDLIVGGVRIVNAGMFVGAQWEQSFEFKHNNLLNPDDKSSGIFSIKKQTFDSDWETNYPTQIKVCTEGSAGAGVIFDYQISAGLKIFALEGEFKRYGQYPAQDAIDDSKESGFIGTWYRFDTSFANRCWFDDSFDGDQDGMPDSFEDKYPQLNSEMNDAMSDPDGDRVINYQEYLDTTNPTNSFDGKSFILEEPIINNSKATLKWNKRGSDEVVYKVCIANEYKDGVECSDLANKEEITLNAIQTSLEKEVIGGKKYYITVYATDKNTTQKSNRRDFYVSDFTANAGVDKSGKVGESITLIARADGNTLNKEFSYSWKENGVEIGKDQYLVKNDWKVGVHKITLIITDQYQKTAQDETLVTITQSTLSKPTNLKTVTTTDAITLNWDSVENAIAYKICMAKEPIVDADKCSEYSGGQLLGEMTNEYIITNFDLDTTYFFRIKGFSEGYLSSWSEEVSGIVENTTLIENVATEWSNEDKTLISKNMIHKLEASMGNYRPTHTLFSPSDQFLVIASESLINIYNSDTQELNRTIYTNVGEHKIVKYSGDGNLIVTVGDDNKIKVWSTRNGLLFKTLDYHSDTISDVSINYNASIIASVGVEYSLKVKNLQTDDVLIDASLDNKYKRVSLNKNGTMLVLSQAQRDQEQGFRANRLKILDIETNSEILTKISQYYLEDSWHLENAIFDDINNNLIIMATSKVFIWDIINQKLLKQFSMSNDNILGNEMLIENNTELFVGSNRIYNLITGEESAYDYNPGGLDAQNIVINSLGSNVFINFVYKGEYVDIDSNSITDFPYGVSSITSAIRNVRSLLVTPNNLLIGVLSGESLTIFNKKTKKIISKFSLSLQKHFQFDFSPDSKLVAIPIGKDLNLIDIESNVTTLSLKGGGAAEIIRFTPDGKNLILAKSEKVLIWNLDKNQVTHEIDTGKWSIQDVGFNIDKNTVILRGKRFRQKVLEYDISTGELINSSSEFNAPRAILNTKGDLVASINYSSGSYLFATIDPFNRTDEGIIVFDDGDMKRDISALVFGVNKIASGHDDGTIKIWNLQTGKLIETFTGTFGAVSNVSFTPDEKQIVVNYSDNTVKIWNLGL